MWAAGATRHLPKSSPIDHQCPRQQHWEKLWFRVAMDEQGLGPLVSKGLCGSPAQPATGHREAPGSPGMPGATASGKFHQADWRLFFHRGRRGYGGEKGWEVGLRHLARQSQEAACDRAWGAPAALPCAPARLSRVHLPGQLLTHHHQQVL